MFMIMTDGGSFLFVNWHVDEEKRQSLFLVSVDFISIQQVTRRDIVNC